MQEKLENGLFKSNTVKQKMSTGRNNWDVETYRNKLENISKLLQT